MNQVLVGDARRIPLPDGSVHLAITSPPYWSLRDYGLPPSVWGGDPRCEHVWRGDVVSADASESARWQHLEGGRGVNRYRNTGTTPESEMIRSEVRVGECQRCTAWRGCLGLEPTPELYVAHIVEVFREVRRVLRPDGVCALNLGDSYANAATPGGNHRLQSRGQALARGIPAGLKPKDKCLVPHRVAIALQADGWWLRNDVPCLKLAAMPESTRDRFTVAHEYIFHLTKSARYYWDADAIRMPGGDWGTRDRTEGKYAKGLGVGEPTDCNFLLRGRNFRTTDLVLDEDGEPLVYLWHPQAFPGSHFATFPVGLAEPWVRAGCPEKGVVLDPFAGAGTVGIACARWNRQFIGVERKPEYAAMANARIAREGFGCRTSVLPNGERTTQLTLGLAGVTGIG